MTKTTIKVVAAAIIHEGKVLICRRSPEKDLGGFWEFPGGKIEGQETPENALSREIFEELRVKVSINFSLGKSVHNYDTKTIELEVFTCALESMLPTKSTDHDSLEWASITELDAKQIAPADVPFIALLKSRLLDN